MARSEADLTHLEHDEEYADLTSIVNDPAYRYFPSVSRLLVKSIPTEGPGPPLPRSGHRMVYSEATGHLYLVGGYCREVAGNEVFEIIRRDTHMFHTDDNEWHDAGPRGTIPNQLASHYLLSIGQMLLVSGGTGVPFGHEREKNLFTYNVYKKSWQRTKLRGDMPIPCYGQTLTHVVLDGNEYIYSIGGTTGRTYNMEVRRLRLKDCCWELMPPGKAVTEAPFGRYRHETVCYNNRLWVFSGMRFDVPENLNMRTIPAYHLTKEKWGYISTIGEIPPFLSCLTATGYKNYVIITGGYLLSGFVNQNVYLLNMDTREWRIIGHWEEACRFHSAAVVPQKKCLIIFGGMRYSDPNIPTSLVVRNNRTWTFPLCFIEPCSLLELSWSKVLSCARPVTVEKVPELTREGVPRHLLERYLSSEPNRS